MTRTQEIHDNPEPNSLKTSGLTITDIGPVDCSSGLLRRYKNGADDASLSDHNVEHLLRTTNTEPPQGEKVHNVTISGKNGTHDTISGIKAKENESAAELLMRLHPNLSEEQLAHEVKQLLKFNKDYGNDLGGGSSLNGSKDILLPSVKYLDVGGRITRIEGPTGRVTDFAYGADGSLVSYKMTGADGRLQEQVVANSAGEWTVTKNGLSETVKVIEVNSRGDIIVTDKQGNQTAHLTNGTDVRTTYKGHRPQKAVATMSGTELGQYIYTYEGDIAKIYATYSNDPSKPKLLCQRQTPEAMARLAIARGQTMITEESGMLIDTSDLSAASHVRENLLRSARTLLGQAVSSYDSSIPSKVGCARMVSQVLKQAGFDKGVIDANVDNLEAKLKARGFVAVSESQMNPGDVVLGVGPGPMDGHIGVYGGNGNVLHNSSSLGVFSEASYSDVFGRFPRRVVYRYVGNSNGTLLEL